MEECSNVDPVVLMLLLPELLKMAIPLAVVDSLVHIQDPVHHLRLLLLLEEEDTLHHQWMTCVTCRQRLPIVKQHNHHKQLVVVVLLPFILKAVHHKELPPTIPVHPNREVHRVVCANCVWKMPSFI
jgi:hypothetical protein